MKKQQHSPLICITVFFIVITLCVFLFNVHFRPEIIVRTVVNNPVPSTTAALQESSARNQALININFATKEELMSLPGIGDLLSDRILVYRREHGLFQQPEDLLNVEGIGPSRLEAILDLITTGG